MPTSTRDTTTTAPAATDPSERDMIVEARTAQEALAEVTAKLGPDASIVEAGKVLRGGVGGFFAREVVQLRARPSAAVAGGDDDARTTTAPDTALQRLLSDLSANVDDEERSFGDVLRRELGVPAPEPEEAAGVPVAPLAGEPPTAPVADVLPDPGLLAVSVPPASAPLAPVPAPPAPVPAPPAPVPVPPVPMPVRALPAPPGASHAEPASAPVTAPPTPSPKEAPSPEDAARPAPSREIAPGAPMWSSESLEQLGLPGAVIDAVRDLEPADDAGWVQAIARAVAPACGHLPSGPMALAGPRATRLAATIGLAVVTPKGRAPRLGSFAVRARDTAANRAWITAARADRWLHVVAGGQGWRELLLDGPRAIAVSAPDALPEALHAALELGVPLGLMLPSGRPRCATPANAVDVAAMVRDLLPRR